MNDNLYLNELKILKDDFQKSKRRLDQRYVEANSPFKIGDIIEQAGGIILIEKLAPTQIHASNDIPGVAYYGKLYTKKLLPRKDKSKLWIRLSQGVCKLLRAAIE